VEKRRPPIRQEKKEKAARQKKKLMSEIPTIKIEKVAAAKEPAANSDSESRGSEVRPAKEKTDKPARREGQSPSRNKAPPRKERCEADGAKVRNYCEIGEAGGERSPGDGCGSKTLRTDDSPAKQEQKASKKELAKRKWSWRNRKARSVKEKEKAATKPQPTRAKRSLRRTNPHRP